ncbi:hypothetical protein LX32DRAFT_260862 [Colletotrichum zoysiae]|uniref:Uncharacterized protein n=1 Tax=Colletotrichum zoysiae TaxID=1216348 RepID=A0AAD9H2P8_9PEZI|nr:hypothetical protein LX32DRAFT_260862 [Colletotrichum zoysiae]
MTHTHTRARARCCASATLASCAININRRPHERRGGGGGGGRSVGRTRTAVHSALPSVSGNIAVGAESEVSPSPPSFSFSFLFSSTLRHKPRVPGLLGWGACHGDELCGLPPARAWTRSGCRRDLVISFSSLLLVRNSFQRLPLNYCECA